MNKLYVILCVLVTLLMNLSNVTCQKLVYLPVGSLYTFQISVGDILVPLMFLLTDITAEFYGKRNTRFCVFLAIATTAVTSVIVGGMDALSATPWSILDNHLFHMVFGVSFLVFIMCVINAYLGQITDITLYLWLKKLTGDKYLWLRNVGSTSVSLLVDTVVSIGLLALWHIFPREQALALMLSTYAYKLFATLCNVPVFYLVIGLVRRFQLPIIHTPHCKKLMD